MSKPRHHCLFIICNQQSFDREKCKRVELGPSEKKASMLTTRPQPPWTSFLALKLAI